MDPTCSEQFFNLYILVPRNGADNRHCDKDSKCKPISLFLRRDSSTGALERVFVHVHVPEVEGKVSILKIPGAQVPGPRRYWKSYRRLLIYSPAFNASDEIFGRNFFMIIQFIPRSHVSDRSALALS